MAESHFFIETMERGGKMITITPEYSPPATKADTWIPIRPSTDTALFLGVAKWIMDNRRYNEPFVKQFTDFPLIVRMDTLKRLHPTRFFPTTNPVWTADGPSFRLQGLTTGSMSSWAITSSSTKTAAAWSPLPATTWASD
jgi:nitrate reductase / nitrite oxidoreductase, alpha subunit